MADRVHPNDSPPHAYTTDEAYSDSSEATLKPDAPASEKPIPSPGTYVIHIPKDQVYRVPPPDNARRYQNLARRKSGGGRSCCCCFCSFLLFFILLLAVSAAVFYFVVKPKSPNYSVDSIAIKGLNLTTSSSTLSPEFDVTVTADNPNRKIGIDYQKDSSVEIFYDNVRLCNGVLPAFYQPSNNVTVFQTVVKGTGIELTSTVTKSLVDAETNGAVPLQLKLRAPVKIKLGSVKTWTITVKVNCDITVDKLTANAKIVSKNCGYGVKLW